MMRRLLLVGALLLLICPISLKGQYYDLGRSPQGIRWNQIQAVSGKIIFPDYFGEGAAKVASYLDTVRPYITYGFRNAPIRVPTVLHTQNMMANGLVLWAPKRMEFEAIPAVAPFAEPWLKQLATHEYRHAVQYGNLFRNFMKPVGWLFGQQAGLVSSVLVPIWLLEGDATMTETQMSTYGRALQPSFTVEYRAYMAEGREKFPLDKWFCGSYRNYLPDHYQLGYQLTAWARETYGDYIWGDVVDYSSRRPYTILTTKFALKKYYKTSVRKIFDGTFADLKKFWKPVSSVPNSSTILPTPLTSYTTYDSPMRLSDTAVVVLKKDMDRPNRFVAVDTRTGAERRVAYTGQVCTPPVMRDGVLYWSEYRYSTLWDQRIFAKACSYDLSTGRRAVVRDRRNALYPTPLPDGELASVGYDYKGSYYLELGGGRTLPFPDTVSVHGLAYDDVTETLAFLALSDGGMSFNAIDLRTGAVRPITRPSYVSVYNLRAGNGKLTFNSIASGKDEIHIYDLREGEEYRLTGSRYGSVSPSLPAGEGEEQFFATYTIDGYRLAKQRIVQDSLQKVPYMNVPQNTVNPPRRKWDVLNIDTVAGATRLDSSEVRRYRKGTHLFNVHSWTPWAFNPFHIADENKIDLSFGVTAMSQNVLSNTSAYLAYGYSGKGGSQVQGGVNYYGLAPKIEVSFSYGGGKQLIYGMGDPKILPSPLKRYFQIRGRIFLPMQLSSGYHNRVLTPSVEMTHMNALLFKKDIKSYEKGYQRMVSSLAYTDNVRMGTRDVLPRWGYALKVASVVAPFSHEFGSLWSFFGRVYTPGIGRHHALMLRGNIQTQKADAYNFFYKDLFPRGADYNITATRYQAFSADYQLPLWYPDGGIPSILYFNRIRLNVYFDYAGFRWVRGISGMSSDSGAWDVITSYGGELLFDLRVLRMPVNNTTVGFHIYKPSDRKGVVTGFTLAFPL